MTPEQRLDVLRTRLQTRFQPEHLHIDDRSWMHTGHSGARAHGGGHYEVSIRCAELEGLTPLQRHRVMNQAVQDLFPDVIHAISFHFPAA